MKRIGSTVLAASCMVLRKPGKITKAFSLSAWRRLFASGNPSESLESPRTWVRDGQLSQRQYLSYEDYVAHQASKLTKVESGLRRRESESLKRFQGRFRMATELAGKTTVLCLGARLGTEVKALHSMGYFAVGIDLNPGDSNQYVLVGDFHQLVFPTESVDAVYVNCLDHTFDLGRVTSEIQRVLKPDGILIADIVAGYEEGFEPGDYEAMIWPTAQSFADRIAAVGKFKQISFRNLAATDDPDWHQVVFRKREAIAALQGDTR